MGALLIPARRTGGLLAGASLLPAGVSSARANDLCFPCVVSGLRLCLVCVRVWSVPVCQLEHLSLAARSLGEPLPRRSHFQVPMENSPLLLQRRVAWPFDKAGEVPFGPDVLSNARILGSFLRQWIRHLPGPLLP